MSDEIVNSVPETAEIAPAASFNEWLGDTTGTIEVENADETATADDVISIVTTAGGQFDVPVASDELLSVQEVFNRSKLFLSGAVEYWVNGVQVETNFQVGPGARISVVGVVKGG